MAPHFKEQEREVEAARLVSHLMVQLRKQGLFVAGRVKRKQVKLSTEEYIVQKLQLHEAPTSMLGTNVKAMQHPRRCGKVHEPDLLLVLQLALRCRIARVEVQQDEALPVHEEALSVHEDEQGLGAAGLADEIKCAKQQSCIFSFARWLLLPFSSWRLALLPRTPNPVSYQRCNGCRTRFVERRRVNKSESQGIVHGLRTRGLCLIWQAA
mmetsp:Transcript_9689/g.34425  ORF Transcript_9689/g.34425 Transcript_9689/m.34425 type:complete len:210 (-) Transcript_9689:2-631(-)